MKNAAGVDTSEFAEKDDTGNLKSEVSKLDIDNLYKLYADKLKSVTVDLSKPSDVVRKNFVWKDVYNAKIIII